jgi:hypothetical protein
MQSSTCLLQIRPFSKRDGTLYKSATTLLATNNIAWQMGGGPIRNVAFYSATRLSEPDFPSLRDLDSI